MFSDVPMCRNANEEKRRDEARSQMVQWYRVRHDKLDTERQGS